MSPAFDFRKQGPIGYLTGNLNFRGEAIASPIPTFVQEITYDGLYELKGIKVNSDDDTYLVDAWILTN